MNYYLDLEDLKVSYLIYLEMVLPQKSRGPDPFFLLTRSKIYLTQMKCYLKVFVVLDFNEYSAPLGCFS
jgi:hypothetical protein